MFFIQIEVELMLVFNNMKKLMKMLRNVFKLNQNGSKDTKDWDYLNFIYKNMKMLLQHIRRVLK